MGKLNIAHHKSYHPYRRDNIERVRRDEEEARQQEAVKEGRMMLADSEARIDLLRQRAGAQRFKPHTRDDDDDDFGPSTSHAEDSRVQPVAGPSSFTSSTGHINLFEDLEHSSLAHARSTKRAPANRDAENEKGIRLAPSAQDLNPWYSDRNRGKGRAVDEDKQFRDLARKSVDDPLTSINTQLAARSTASAPTANNTSYKPRSARSTNRSEYASMPPPSDDPRPPPPPQEARLARESSERERALALIRRKKREIAGSETPSTVHGGMSREEGYGDVFNRREVEEARKVRERRWDGGKERESGGGRDGRVRARW